MFHRRHFLLLAIMIAAKLAGGAAFAADSTLAENPSAAKPSPVEGEPHIALLLPLNAPAFRQPADAVRQGFLAAAKAQPDTPPVRVYPTTEETGNILATYVQCLQQGARAVVGPLTKNAVGMLASSKLVGVPTLSLTTLEQDQSSLPPLLYLLGLSIEDEARQVAELAVRSGYRKPLIVASDSPLGKRMQAAFSEHWRHEGRALAGEMRFALNGDMTILRSQVQQFDADMIFLAANAREARSVRPYLASTLPAFATSQIFAGKIQDPGNIDLAGIRFIDMPWLLQPDHTATMIYPHFDTPMGAELERLYALGIDALRLASQLYKNPATVSGTLDGVTGRLSIGSDQQVRRTLIEAEFQQDSVVVIDSEP